ncbi:MAG: argininosuccinate lyase [Dialister sp.]|jgi:argininosuccinate lyase|nr:argininosuccinate lyase [Dialister sp.]MDD6904247.1 argininosuccinate lyase [Dialister sp.]MDD7073903.1 argininosuccinate lyase [Dialister sp.]MDD7197258.1 argininosuccinate lyase [Dialister sp.]MDD7666677.1 argininosuccinate lyase [Dialister sp.]
MSDMMWGGRFTKAEEKNALDFNASISYDCRMYREDIAGSIAHAKMLAAHGIISKEDQEKITKGLISIKKEIDEGTFPFSVELEDIHMNIEKRLTEEIGDAGARLHTARSRNDQCALDLHMYMKRNIARLSEKLIAVLEALLAASKKYQDVILPGYTHMQRAQPVLFAHHMLAYFAMLERDFKRLEDCYDMCDMSPIGACALAGTTYPTHPEEEANDLHFASVYGNSLDAVSDRDYLLQFLSFASICAMHLSRLSEEFIYWSTSEFQFIELDDGYSTGSSIMPQKKNPDMCELIRGKTGRVYGHLIGLLTVMKGLPLAYDKDMQEDKEGVFDALDTLYFALDIYAGMISTMTVNGDHTRQVLESDFSNATDMADYLAKKGLPFRQAHAVVGNAVHYCIEHHKVLLDLSMEEFRSMSPLFEEDIKEALSIENCVKNRESYGGTGPKSVERQQTHAGDMIAKMKEMSASWKEEMAFLG